MAELAADSRRVDSPLPPPPPIMPDDVLREILLRLPPEPIHLFRASLVSNHWRALVHDASFLRRCRDFHGGTPPVLGFFKLTRPPLFVPISGSFAVSATTVHHGDWFPLDCNRGRALLISERSRALLVRDLVTGDELHLPLPPGFKGSWDRNSALLCAAAGHADQCDCRSCPFVVAFVFSHGRFITSACLYSSETGVWGEVTSMFTGNQFVERKAMALVGNTLYCLLDNNWIIEFDFDTYNLQVIGELSYKVLNSCIGHIIMTTQDGQLGLAGVGGFSLQLWSSTTCIDDGMVTWADRRVIDLEKLLAPEVVAACTAPVWPIGYAQDADVIFIEVYPSGVYMIHLKSLQIEKVSENMVHGYICPYTSFYAPGNAIVFDTASSR
jgi:hypothetical protein